MVSNALCQILAAGIQQTNQLPSQALPLQPQVQGQLPGRPCSPSQRDSISSVDSAQGDDYPEDIEFSEDEGLLLDSPANYKSVFSQRRLDYTRTLTNW